MFLVLGPFVWAVVVMLFVGWPHDGAQLLVLYSQGMCVSVAAVSMFLPAIRGPTASKNSNRDTTAGAEAARAQELARRDDARRAPRFAALITICS